MKIATVLLLGACALASGGTIGPVSVFGNDNPFLAGHPDGTLCCTGDNAPTHSPTEVLGISFFAGQVLQFAVAPGGFFSHVGGGSGPAADGSGVVNSGPSASIGGYSAPLNALVGVFLDNSVPGGAAPATLDFGGGGLTTDFAALAPSLRQVFFIGDGLRADNVTPHQFIVPAGATRLFLGSTDGFGWYNNSGSHDVTINFGEGEAGVPEPSAVVLMTLGLGLLGFRRFRR